jgi:hypothetical protein
MMHPATSSASLPPPFWRTFLLEGLTVLVGMATVAVILVGPPNPLVAVVPAAVVLLVWGLIQAPLVLSVSVLLTLLLAVDDNGDSFGQWRTPMAVVGDVLHFRLDAVLGLPGMAVTGMEIAAGGFLTLWLWRRIAGSAKDRPQVRVASVLVDFLLLYVAGVVISEMVGLARGLSVAPWKLRNLLHPILLALLFLAAYRGPRDQRLVGRIVVFAACARAILAIVVQRVAVSLTGGPYAHATSHGDSVLFSVASFILLIDLLERPDRHRLLRTILLLPLIVAGMVENDRRLVWVMVALMFAAAYVALPMRGWKRAMSRAVLIALPVLVIYAAAGWNSQSRFFAPLRTFRTVSDTSVDRSAYWREVENWNIVESMRANPILGTGLGGEYTEHMPNDDVSQGFKEFREWPHNTVLGLLLLMGLLPFTATWLLLPLVIFLSVRSCRMAVHAEDRVAALSCIGAAVACMVLAYGDTGAHFPQYKIFVALAVAVSARLAVATGAWPARLRAVGG